jgi:hypothetical protein
MSSGSATPADQQGIHPIEQMAINTAGQMISGYTTNPSKGQSRWDNALASGGKAISNLPVSSPPSGNTGTNTNTSAGPGSTTLPAGGGTPTSNPSTNKSSQ